MLYYIAGLATPVILLGLYGAWISLQEWRHTRRYQRAWDKFAAEFADLTPGQLEFFKRKWADEDGPDRATSDRDRYFMMRWQNGRTTEV